MRRKSAIAACFGLALLASGCNPTERMFFREGIGTELYAPEMLPASELQNIYLDHLCRQSAPFVGEVPSCSRQELTTKEWSLIVQAGMNDIDARCDAYLAWLDQKKRENAAILAEIGAIRFAVDALTNPAVASGISPVALASIAAAFGLATNTLANINSLLLTVDHTTVQSVVFMTRRDFRLSLLRTPIENKPIAVHALRSYLTICMPMTISANINSTVTVFQQTGSGVLGKREMVSPSTIGMPRTAAPATARQQAGVPTGRPQIPSVANADSVFLNYTPNDFPPSVIRRLQNVLCVPTTEVGTIGETTAHHIAIFEASDMFEAADNRFIVQDGKIDVNERDVLQKSPGCPRNSVMNFYERTIFGDGTAPDLKDRLNTFVIDRLNRVTLPGVADLPRDTPLAGVRDRIRTVRTTLIKNPETAQRLRALPDRMANQWTRDLFDVLSRLPRKQ